MMEIDKKVKKKNLLTGLGLLIFIILLFIFTVYNGVVFERAF